MGHNDLRHDKECQNCGHTVEEIYCPHCGQKNTETRQSFGHLIGHFAEDFTHYDGAFWKTIKYLLFRPAFLTKEYLMGKRQMYVPPVKLYIFISFITFFLPSLIPSSESENEYIETEYIPSNNRLKIKENTSMAGFGWREDGFVVDNPLTYRTVKEMDSIEALKPESLRLSGFDYKMAKKIIHIYSKNTPLEVGEKFTNAFPKNVTKAIFIYMPIFAFWLWLFHGKKRWVFFDHGIFTLHYFSFIMITTTCSIIMIKLAMYISNSSFYSITIIITFLLAFWQMFYFYRGHRKMYHENWIISFLKSTMMFLINLFLMIFLTIILMLYTFYSLH
ncbi:hypothetical protein D3C87_340400 [compost metagenome]